MILVTGATGNVGREVIRRLEQNNVPLRALSRKPDAVKCTEKIEWVKDDFTDANSLAQAVAGVDKIVLISPAHPDMVAYQTAVLKAAHAAGVKHIVKLSGLGAGPGAAIRLPRLHYEIEQKIIDAGIPYTFIRPNLFMQVLLGSADSIANEGAIYAPAGEGAISFTDVNDIANVITCAIGQPGHENKIYEITGPDALTYGHVAELIGNVLGKSIRYVAVSPEVARESMLSSGMDPWLANAFLELFSIYRAGYGATVSSGTVREITGLSPTSLSVFARTHKVFFKSLNAA